MKYATEITTFCTRHKIHSSIEQLMLEIAEELTPTQALFYHPVKLVPSAFFMGSMRKRQDIEKYGWVYVVGGSPELIKPITKTFRRGKVERNK